MKRRYIIVAQGTGFYGNAFFTLDMDTTSLGLALERSCPTLMCQPFRRNETNDLQWTSHFVPDTTITVLPFEGAVQEKPVTSLDSGHGVIDMHVLRFLHKRLHDSHAENGSNAARLVEMGGWKERVRRIGLKSEDVLAMAMGSTHPPKAVAGRAFEVGETVECWDNSAKGEVLEVLRHGEIYLVEFPEEIPTIGIQKTVREVPYVQLKPPTENLV